MLMRASSGADETAPEAKVAAEQKEIVRWLLIPRWFKALCVGSAMFGAVYGYTYSFAWATASAAAGILVFMAAAISYASYRKYRELRLPS